jgi:thiamine-monophosphate kinase
VVDTSVAGVHFPPDLDARDIGYRSVAVNLSDMAAMGASPRWMTLALTLVEAEPTWLHDFAEGIYDAADEFAVSLVGGDTTRGAELVVSVQLLGTVSTGAAIRRSGGRADDVIYVTGTVGDAAAGLGFLQNPGTGCASERTLVRRFSRPQPRVEFGKLLAPLASAAIDISDGLYGDLAKMLLASGVGGRLDVAALPGSAEITQMFDRRAQIDLMLNGGDDYELCFTVAPADGERVEVLGRSLGLHVSPIGTVTAGNELVCIDDGRVIEVDGCGYRHFEVSRS